MVNPKTILIIEDNDFVRMQITNFLRDDGYDVMEENDGEAGIETLKSHKDSIICILADIRMEPVDGFDFINKMHSLDIKKSVILITGDNNPDVLSRASSLGVVSVLMKPIDKDRLLKMVGRIIAGSGHV